MPLERLTFDNGNFKAAMENFTNTKTKERESFDRAITDKNNELNDLQVFFVLQTRGGVLHAQFRYTIILVYLGQAQ